LGSIRGSHSTFGVYGLCCPYPYVSPLHPIVTIHCLHCFLRLYCIFLLLCIYILCIFPILSLRVHSKILWHIVIKIKYLYF
ncbi:hypothetical protein NDU88_000564, partial [Pleurodeles waltl]